VTIFVTLRVFLCLVVGTATSATFASKFADGKARHFCFRFWVNEKNVKIWRLASALTRHFLHVVVVVVVAAAFVVVVVVVAVAVSDASTFQHCISDWVKFSFHFLLSDVQPLQRDVSSRK
jgi:hypothetical protein